MKNYTPALVNTGKAPFTLKRLFLGSSGAKNYYYRARHRDEDTYIMWIEAERFGKTLAFPCVLEEEGDPMIYQPGKGMAIKQQNARMVQRWNLLITPTEFKQNFEAQALTAEEFHKEYGGYKFKREPEDEPDAPPALEQAGEDEAKETEQPEDQGQ